MKRKRKRVSTPSRPPQQRVGERLVAALTEVRDALASGEPLQKRFTVRTLEIPDPGIYVAGDVRKLRDRLRVSQAVFARLVGVSPELVQHWEQGVTTPRAIARRLLDEISRDPAAYLKRTLSPARVAVA